MRIHDVKIDQEYVQWLNEIKARYRNTQIKASIRINVEQLLFNWQLGRDLVVRKAEEKWGSGIVEQVSLDLQAEFPGAKGFSTTNLWYMKQWYQFYSAAIPKLQQFDGEFQIPDRTPAAGAPSPPVATPGPTAWPPASTMPPPAISPECASAPTTPTATRTWKRTSTSSSTPPRRQFCLNRYSWTTRPTATS